MINHVEYNDDVVSSLKHTNLTCKQHQTKTGMTDRNVVGLHERTGLQLHLTLSRQLRSHKAKHFF